jgi:hypothetical protein
MQEIQIFKPGQFRPMQGDAIRFSDSDLAACAAAYDPARHEAPIVIGHPATDDPAWGWIKSLKFADGVLSAVPDQVNPVFADQVKAGAYKKVSASFWRPDAPGNPTPGSWALRHVGFLGAQPPAVKGLAPIQFAGSAEGVVDFGMVEAWGWGALTSLFRRLRDRMIEKDGLEAADQTLSIYDIDQLARAEEAERQDVMADQQPDAMPDFAESDASKPDATKPKELELTTATLSQGSGPSAAELAAKQADLTAREKALSDREAALRKTEAAAFADALINEGRLTPAQKDQVVTLLGWAGAPGSVAFAEGGEAPEAMLRGFLKSLPTAVDFSETAKAGESVEFASAHDLADQARALIVKAKAEGRTLSEVQAVSILTAAAR